MVLGHRQMVSLPGRRSWGAERTSSCSDGGGVGLRTTEGAGNTWFR